MVPNVVGRRVVWAKARIDSAHCAVGRFRLTVSAAKKKGRVLAQHPKPGDRLRRGAKVDLTVGKGAA